LPETHSSTTTQSHRTPSEEENRAKSTYDSRHAAVSNRITGAAVVSREPAERTQPGSRRAGGRQVRPAAGRQCGRGVGADRAEQTDRAQAIGQRHLSRLHQGIKDGFVEVKFKLPSGREDHAGGLLWRAKDVNNYSLARANALQDNLTIYRPINGRRTERSGPT